MTWVKTCGMRTWADVDAAVTAGADAIGLVLIEASPRALTIEQARALAASAPVPAVILTVDLEPEEALRAMRAVGAGGVQPYGRHSVEAAAAVARVGGFVLFPLRAEGPVDLSVVPIDQTPLVDAYSESAFGGTGSIVNDQWLPESGGHYVLAGGLTPENVAARIATFNPWGVDASSGLESSRGVKDGARIRAFVEEAKKA